LKQILIYLAQTTDTRSIIDSHFLDCITMINGTMRNRKHIIYMPADVDMHRYKVCHSLLQSCC